MRTTLSVTVLALTLAAGQASARSFRVGQVPNGAQFQCNLCHSDGGGSSRNVFGQQVESTLNGQNVDWGAIFDLDADEDGFTNGEELGDPDGDGTPDEDADATDPADDRDFPQDSTKTTDDTDTGTVDTGDPATDGSTDGATDDDGANRGCSVAPAPASGSLAFAGVMILLGLRRRRG